MDKVGFEKLDTETGGVNNKEKTSVVREPFPTLAEYSSLIEEFSKYRVKFSRDFNKVRKDVREIENLKIRADSVESNFKSLETRIGSTNTFMQWMTGIIVGVFFVTGVIIFIDYAKNKGDGYKHFVNQVDSLRQNYYSKTEVDKILSSFKECIWYNGLSHCLK